MGNFFSFLLIRSASFAQLYIFLATWCFLSRLPDMSTTVFKYLRTDLDISPAQHVRSARSWSSPYFARMVAYCHHPIFFYINRWEVGLGERKKKKTIDKTFIRLVTRSWHLAEPTYFASCITLVWPKRDLPFGVISRPRK